MSLVQRLDVARAALRRYGLCLGALYLVVAIIATIAGFFIIDWLAVNRILPLGWGDTLCRVVLMIAVIGIIAHAWWTRIQVELRTSRNDDHMALRVERRFPQLGGRLISAIQLTRARDTFRDEGVSLGMIDGLATEAESRTQELTFSEIIDRKPLQHMAKLAALVVVAAVVATVWRPDYASAICARMALMQVDYPTATRITAVTHSGRVAEGEPYIIEVELDAERFLPETAEASVEYANGRDMTLALHRVTDAPLGKVLYRGEITQALHSFTFRPAAYDHRWQRWETVLVVKSPAISAVAITCMYPGYLNLQPTESTVGDVRVPEGTEVNVHITATKPLAIADLGVRLGMAEDKVTQALTLSDDKLSATGSFVVEQSGSWSLSLVDLDGLSPRAIPSYIISAIPDQVPQIIIVTPSHDKLASTKAVWPLQFTVMDDHGIGQGWLKYTVSALDAPLDPENEPLAVSVPLPGLAGPDETSVSRETTFDLGRLGVQPNQRVTYWLEVSDNRTPAPGVGVSNKRRFTVLDNATLAVEINRQRADLFERIGLIKDRQKEARDAVEVLRDQVNGHN